MFITVGAAKIYATAFGPATATRTILGLGGWIGSWELWAEPFSILSQTWRTISYDHRGSGATLAPAESITAATLVDDLFAVLNAYEVEACVLAAESAGAVTALSAALRQPERITGLVIVDGMYYREPTPEKDMFLLGLQQAYPMTLDRFVQACVPEADSDHIKQWGRQIIGRASQESAIALYRAAGSVDLRAELPAISQPTLIIHGDADAIVPVAAARHLAQAIPNTRLTILPGAGHVPTLTRPQKIAAEIDGFFGG
ncbi:MAG: alpha/beta hydrolase [Anaerolineales bacterium]|nr:alpha/beta hydrolase [Anaerolineales bacterium]